MRKIRTFERRLPRFDHLERLTRTHNFYVVPTRFYADEDEGGPRDGLTYLLLGKRLRQDKDKVLKGYLIRDFPADWDAEPRVEAKYRVGRHARLPEIMYALEVWAIDSVRERLPPRQQNEPGYVFDLESCLCNWQKGE